MATGYFVIYITPRSDFIQIPDGYTTDFLSDAFEARVRMEDRFVDFNHEPTVSEKASAINTGIGEFEAELRALASNLWRLRVRYPVSYTTEQRGGLAHLYRLSDPRIPSVWGNAADFWGVFTTTAKHLQLHTYIATTLGFGPIAGAWAALDPNNQNQFLPNAVQTALGLSNAQQLARVTALRNALQNLGYVTTNLNAIVSSPAGKTEDTLIRALVHDLGFTMADLKRAAMSIA